MESFLVSGHKVTYKDGLAEFTRFGVSIRVRTTQFNLVWAIKMDSRLEQCVSMFGPFFVDKRGK